MGFTASGYRWSWILRLVLIWQCLCVSELSHMPLRPSKDDNQRELYLRIQFLPRRISFVTFRRCPPECCYFMTVISETTNFTYWPITWHASTAIVGLGLFCEVRRSHPDTTHSVGLLWTSDRPVAETSTCQHTSLTRQRYPCPQRDSNPQPRQVSGRRPTP